MATTAVNPSSPAPIKQTKCRATQTTPAWHLLLPNEPCSLDIEFQKYKIRLPNGSWTKEQHRIGRISITNTANQVVLDVFAIYRNEDGVQKCWQPARFGVVPKKDLRFENGGVNAKTVERWAKQLMQGRTVVVHGGKHDLEAFYHEKDAYAGSSGVVDTQILYSDWQDDGTPGLALLAKDVLGIEDFRSSGEHSSVEDAKATMELFLRERPYDREAEEAKLVVGVAKVRRARKRHGGYKGSEASRSWRGKSAKEDGDGAELSEV